MGLFPAAFTLSDNGFDLVALLRLPGYTEGGPNTHSTSLVTLLTAGVWAITGGGNSAYVFIHLLHYVFAAVALVTLQRFAEPVFGSSASWLLCLSVLLYPVFSAQVGYMYMEVPLFLCAVSGLLAWRNGQLGLAALWSTLAVAVKAAGIVVPAALVVAALLESRNVRVRIRRAFAVAAAPALWAGFIVLLRMLAVAGGARETTLLPPFDLGGMFLWLHYLNRFLLNVPDLLILILIFLVTAGFSARRLVTVLALNRGDDAGSDSDEQALYVVGLSGLVIACFLLLFFVVLPVAADFAIVLPRYYVVIVPFLLLWCGYAAQVVLSGRKRSAALVCFAALSVFFYLNTDGEFYPPDIDTEGPGNDFALAERSNSYLRLNSLQRDAVEYLEATSIDSPVYYGHYEHYLFSYPELGYAKGALPDGRSLSLVPLDDSVLRLSGPGCLYLFYNYPWLGGERMRRFLRQVDQRGDLVTETVREFRDGPYRMHLIRVRRPSATCHLKSGG